VIVVDTRRWSLSPLLSEGRADRTPGLINNVLINNV
jgi:hypothetical protein